MPAGPGGLTAESSTLARLTTAVPAPLLYAASRCFLSAGTPSAPGSTHNTGTTPSNAPDLVATVHAGFAARCEHDCCCPRPDLPAIWTRDYPTAGRDGKLYVRH